MRDTQIESQISNNSNEQEISKFRQGLPQILAVSVKNVLLLGYGMTLGFPTIVIPAIQGGDGRQPATPGEIILNKDQISWLSSINLICVPLGCIFSGAFTQPIGKRRAMQLVNIPMLAAWLFYYFSQNVYHLYAGLCLSGLSGGLMEAPVLTYVAEITQPRFRGMLAATGSTCAIIGVFSQFLMGTFLKWRTVALISCVTPFISTLLLLFVPESPHWLIRKKRYEEARASLAWLRGWVPIDKIETEFNQIQNHLEHHQDESNQGCLAKSNLYTNKNFLFPYAIICLCFFIGHFSGMTTLQTYAVQIFHTLKAPIDKYYATSMLGCAELIGTIICVILVHYTGKRPLVFISTLGCATCFLGTATYAYFLDSVQGTAINNIIANVSALDPNDYYKIIPLNYTSHRRTTPHEEMITTTMIPDYDYMIDNSTISFDYNDTTNGTDYEFEQFDNQEFNILFLNESDFNLENDTYIEPSIEQGSGIPADILVPIPHLTENKLLWIPLTLLLCSALLSHMGIKLIPWMLIGELYPASVRSCASGLSGGTGYVFAFLANKLFLKMIATLTLPGTFALYSSISITGAIILFFILPETEGKSLQEIENHFISGGQKLNTNRKRKTSHHHDRIKSPPEIVVTPTSQHPNPNNDQLAKMNKARHAGNKKGISNRKVTPLPNFDVQQWESNAIFQKHLEETRLQNQNKFNQERTAIEPINAVKMGLKKNKNAYKGRINAGFLEENESTRL